MNTTWDNDEYKLEARIYPFEDETMFITISLLYLGSQTHPIIKLPIIDLKSHEVKQFNEGLKEANKIANQLYKEFQKYRVVGLNDYHNFISRY